MQLALAKHCTDVFPAVWPGSERCKLGQVAPWYNPCTSQAAWEDVLSHPISND
jgi:hypothetical protein